MQTDRSAATRKGSCRSATTKHMDENLKQPPVNFAFCTQGRVVHAANAGDDVVGVTKAGILVSFDDDLSLLSAAASEGCLAFLGEDALGDQIRSLVLLLSLSSQDEHAAARLSIHDRGTRPQNSANRYLFKNKNGGEVKGGK